MFNSLEKMAHSIQRTRGNKDRSLFHHVIINILIQYQLSLIVKNWDQFLVENGLGHTKFWLLVVLNPDIRE